MNFQINSKPQIIKPYGFDYIHNSFRNNIKKIYKILMNYKKLQIIWNKQKEKKTKK